MLTFSVYYIPFLAWPVLFIISSILPCWYLCLECILLKAESSLLHLMLHMCSLCAVFIYLAICPIWLFAVNLCEFVYASSVLVINFVWSVFLLCLCKADWLRCLIVRYVYNFLSPKAEITIWLAYLINWTSCMCIKKANRLEMGLRSCDSSWITHPSTTLLHVLNSSKLFLFVICVWSTWYICFVA